MANYYLMHRNDICGKFTYDEISGIISSYHDMENGLSPFLGNSNLKKIQKWWEMRAIPASRSTIQEILRNANCFTPGSYLAKNLALSMTDSYWIRPEESSLQYDDVKFSNLAMYHGKKIPYHNASSYDPNASLGGQMEKYWDFSSNVPILVKESYKYYGQQSINEVFATHLHNLQASNVPYVKYSASIEENNGIFCRCHTFTSEQIEFISAYEVLESQKIRNDFSLYDAYINICAQNGIDKDIIQSFMDYQTLTDFVISNTDEHLQNFGILRDTESRKLIGPAPIFDSGNSMFYADDRKIPYTRAGILGRKITSFYQSEEKMLSQVQNRNIVRDDLLPHPNEINQIYGEANIPEWKINMIRANYETKLLMLHEFQHGKTISLYHERQIERSEHKKQPKLQGQTFILLCGIPGLHKSKEADQLQAIFEQNGYPIADSKKMYPANKLLSKMGFILDKKNVMAHISPVDGYKNTVIRLSLDDIQQELSKESLHFSDDLCNLLADVRMKTAFISGASVILDAAGLSKEIREHYLGIAENAGVTNKILHFMQISSEPSSAVSLSALKVMKNKLLSESPSKDEGWDSIIFHSPK